VGGMATPFPPLDGSAPRRQQFDTPHEMGIDSAKRYTEMGVDVFLGSGRFTGGDRVEVAGQTLRFKKAVIATCWNFLETSDDLRYEALVPLLAEEYEPRDIEGFRPHIEECIHDVMHEFEFKERVVEAYDKLGVSIHDDKATVMRALAKDFPRGEMKKVYAIIVGNR